MMTFNRLWFTSSMLIHYLLDKCKFCQTISHLPFRGYIQHIISVLYVFSVHVLHFPYLTFGWPALMGLCPFWQPGFFFPNKYRCCCYAVEFCTHELISTDALVVLCWNCFSPKTFFHSRWETEIHMRQSVQKVSQNSPLVAGGEWEAEIITMWYDTEWHYAFHSIQLATKHNG